jgi:hypothetical protein
VTQSNRDQARCRNHALWRMPLQDIMNDVTFTFDVLTEDV